jgi:hypothetical protein
MDAPVIDQRLAPMDPLVLLTQTQLDKAARTMSLAPKRLHDPVAAQERGHHQLPRPYE